MNRIAADSAGCRRKIKSDGKKLGLDSSKDTMEITYSYSVYFKEDLDIEYSNRWDLYFLNNTESDSIHWLAVINSLVILSLLTALVAIIMVRTLSRDIQTYNQDLHGEDDKNISEDVSGWKLVHGDVFRPPVHKGVLASLVGAGVQMFVMALAVLGFATFGFLSPSYRGGFLTLALVLFVFAGYDYFIFLRRHENVLILCRVFSGYFSSRLYKSFKGVKWLKNALRVGINIYTECE